MVKLGSGPKAESSWEITEPDMLHCKLSDQRVGEGGKQRAAEPLSVSEHDLGTQSPVPALGWPRNRAAFKPTWGPPADLFQSEGVVYWGGLCWLTS